MMRIFSGGKCIAASACVGLLQVSGSAHAYVMLSDSFETGDTVDYTIRFGDPAVVGSGDAFATNSLMFETPNPDPLGRPGVYGSRYDQAEYSLDNSHLNQGIYTLSFDMYAVTIDSAFTLLWDTPIVRNIAFKNDGSISLFNYDAGIDDIVWTTIGSYNTNELIQFSSVLDYQNDLLQVSINGIQIFSDAWNPEASCDLYCDPGLAGFRFSLDSFTAAGGSGQVGEVYIDNVLLTNAVVPIPAALWLFGSALAGLGWVRRNRVAANG